MQLVEMKSFSQSFSSLHGKFMEPALPKKWVYYNKNTSVTEHEKWQQKSTALPQVCSPAEHKLAELQPDSTLQTHNHHSCS